MHCSLKQINEFKLEFTSQLSCTFVLVSETQILLHIHHDDVFIDSVCCAKDSIVMSYNTGSILRSTWQLIFPTLIIHSKP